MARREWAEKWAFDASEGDTAQIRMTVAAKRLQAEHARAVRIVKAAYAKTWKNGYVNEAYREGRLNMAQELLAALTKGRA